MVGQSDELDGLEELTLDEFTLANPLFEEDVYDAIKLENCVNRRKVIGGPSKDTVLKHIEYIKTILPTL